MSRAKEVLTLLHMYEDLSVGLQGLSKATAKRKVNKILYDVSKGFFNDDAWQAVNNVWKALSKEGIEVVITKAEYTKKFPLETKIWQFEIYFMNNANKKTVLYGVLTASGAGDVKDPLSKYDIVAYVS